MNITETAMAAALCELLEKKPLDRITVKDITDLCGMTRNSFYYHFHDVYELLDRIFTREIERLISIYETEGDGFLEGLNFLYERKRMINHIYKSMDREQLDRYLNTVVYRHALTVVGKEFKKSGYSEKVLQISAGFYKNALTGAVIEWIEGGMKESPDTLAELYNELFSGTIDAVFRSVNKAISGG